MNVIGTAYVLHVSDDLGHVNVTGVDLALLRSEVGLELTFHLHAIRCNRAGHRLVHKYVVVVIEPIELPVLMGRLRVRKQQEFVEEREEGAALLQVVVITLEDRHWAASGQRRERLHDSIHQAAGVVVLCIGDVAEAEDVLEVVLLDLLLQPGKQTPAIFVSGVCGQVNVGYDQEGFHSSFVLAVVFIPLYNEMA